jgi:hypothetical protein
MRNSFADEDTTRAVFADARTATAGSNPRVGATAPAHDLVCRLRDDWPWRLRSGSGVCQDTLALCGRTALSGARVQ